MKKSFYLHLVWYVGISIMLASVATAVGDARFWIMFPIIPLTMMLLIHYVLVYGFPISHVLSKSWEEEEYAKALDQLTYEQKLLSTDTMDDEDFLSLDDIKVPARSTRSSDFV